MDQSGQRKAADGQPKLCAWNAPQVDCIGKGKATTPCQFGVKVGIASIEGNRFVGAKAFPGNPYDGHTLNEQLEQASNLMQDCRSKPVTAFVDLGYRGVDAGNLEVHTMHWGKSKRINEPERKLLGPRQAIKPIYCHLVADHRMDRCRRKGEQGDGLHAVLCAEGYNLRWLLRMTARKGITFVRRLYLRVRAMAAVSPNWQEALGALLVRTLTQHA